MMSRKILAHVFYYLAKPAKWAANIAFFFFIIAFIFFLLGGQPLHVFLNSGAFMLLLIFIGCIALHVLLEEVAQRFLNDQPISLPKIPFSDFHQNQKSAGKEGKGYKRKRRAKKKSENAKVINLSDGKPYKGE